MGSKSPDINYAGSPTQNRMMDLIMPGFEKMYGGGGGIPGSPDLWNIPNYNVPNTPNASPYSVPVYKTTGYNVPGTADLMPNKGWFDNLDPKIKSGLMEPTNEAAREMLNVMGGQGLMSARGGYSGESQTALADLYAKGSNTAAMNAWNMISPIKEAEWSAKLGANKYGADIANLYGRDIWGAKLGANKDAWGFNTMADMTKWQADLGKNMYGAQSELQRNMMPWSLMSNLFGGSIPNAVVSPGSGSNLMNNFMYPLMTMGGMYGLNSLFRR